VDNRHIISGIGALCAAILLTACTRTGLSGEPIVVPTALVKEGEIAGQLVNAGPLPTLDDVPERPLYVLNVTLDYDTGDVHAQQRIEFVNPTGRAVNEIKFNLPPARRAGAVEFRDARIFGQPQALPFELAETVLTVKLPSPLAPDKAIAMTFDFTFKVPLQEVITGIGGDDTSRGPKSLTCGHWYVMLAPFRNGDWDTPTYVPIGDPYTSELADYEVSILAPEGVYIAGSGDENREGRLWRYSLPKARVFAFAASKVFDVQTLEDGGITYIHYGYPEHKDSAEAVLFTASRAVKLFGVLYGPYPYRTLRIVATGRQQGQEYSGMVGIGTTIYQGYPGRGGKHDLIATTVHEVAHQWWFNVVGNDQIRTPWLDESFARYGELRYYQEFYTKDADWWYGYYILGSKREQLTGPIDLGIAEYSTSRDYINAVYRRGMVFMNELRKRIGQDTLDAALKDYYRTEAYKLTDQDAFFDAIARHSSEDISGLVQSFFSRGSYLPCNISANAPGCRRISGN
jgi:hypothetical protein